ncbi:MAG: hypothetical protein J0H09_08155 [Burkholderiales bacterium]|nr:hypothetical protein [Burkholderiales bacterium]ODU68388.1 MAG: hypothetical protein ABT05_02860 [Lautropia sp. SCN 66-9]
MPDSAPTTPADADSQQDTHQTAIAALLFMLSRYRRVPCARTHAAIIDHLARVAGDARSTPALRQAAAMLHREWAAESTTGAEQPLGAGALAASVPVIGGARGRLH